MKLLEFTASLLARVAIDVAGAPYATAHVHLYKTQIDILPTTPLATFVAAEATYDGYGEQAPTWLSPTISKDGTVEQIMEQAIFLDTGSVTPNNIWGVFITDDLTSELLFAGQFDDAPIPMGTVHALILLNFRFRPLPASEAAITD